VILPARQWARSRRLAGWKSAGGGRVGGMGVGFDRFAACFRCLATPDKKAPLIKNSMSRKKIKTPTALIKSSKPFFLCFPIFWPILFHPPLLFYGGPVKYKSQQTVVAKRSPP